ncbi:MAG: DoxX family protein [Rhodanobacter sp.]
MSWWNLAAVPLLARICLVVLFPFSAMDKILYWKDALKQAQSSFLPGGALLVVIAIVIELVAPACILFAWHDRLAAFALAGFCVVTAVLYHPFWSFSDFWTPGESKGRRHFWDFLKNFGLAGGLLLVVVMAGFAPATGVIDQPLSSTPTAAAPVAVDGAISSHRSTP